MRPRNETLLGLAVLTVLVIITGGIGRARARRPDEDPRPSSFLAGPNGVRGLADAVERLGLAVRRFRERSQELRHLPPAKRQTLVVLDPSAPLSPPETGAVLEFNRDSTDRGGHLLVAGRGTEPVMRCFGYRLARRRFDSIAVALPGGPTGKETAWVHQTLVPTRETVASDSSRIIDIGAAPCRVPAIAAVDTLLLGPAGAIVALRLTRADVARSVTLVSDVNLFRNRVVRRTAAGAVVLRMLTEGSERVVFEEYHHGFGASGSLARATLDWSLRSPWGWAAWQAAAVGLIALLFGAARFGPARSGIVRTRRSQLEHVRALAGALGAARGHDVAIAALVRGLRRRVAPGALRGRGNAAAWLGQLERSLTRPRARTAVRTLRTLTRPGQPSSSVLAAANAVEDLWEELRP